MVVIYFNQEGPNFQLFCGSCQTPLDVVSRQVLTALLDARRQVLCMDCDGGADEIPEQLFSPVTPYSLVLDGMRVKVDPYHELNQTNGGLTKRKKEIQKIRKAREERKTDE